MSKALEIALDLRTEFPNYLPVLEAADELQRMHKLNESLIWALADCISVMEHKLPGLATIEDELHYARCVMAEAKGKEWTS